ncbi:MAG TPA: hypothetical protein VF178_11965 [Gemmatimonadaceae bacterium]
MPHHDEHNDPRRPGRSDKDREQDVREPDDEEAYERALQREPVDLPGDMEEDRNLSGSSTYETLFEEEEEEEEGERDRGSSGEPGNR